MPQEGSVEVSEKVNEEELLSHGIPWENML